MKKYKDFEIIEIKGSLFIEEYLTYKTNEIISKDNAIEIFKKLFSEIINIEIKGIYFKIIYNKRAPKFTKIRIGHFEIAWNHDPIPTTDYKESIYTITNYK